MERKNSWDDDTRCLFTKSRVYREVTLTLPLLETLNGHPNDPSIKLWLLLQSPKIRFLQGSILDEHYRCQKNDLSS